MSYVLADSRGWLDPSSDKSPFEVKEIGNFKALRSAVNEKQADFFMWEHFTTRKYWENGEVKYIGDIETPWPSWVIAARETAKPELEDLMDKINRGIGHFKQHPEEAVDYITSNMHYSKADAEQWMERVRFPDDVRGVARPVIQDTIDILQKAGLLKSLPVGADRMIAVERVPS